MMEDESDDTKRKTRNLSEKKRRDQFNVLVNELGAILSSGSRKMDKSTVLKATVSYLKNQNDIAVRSRVHDIQEEWKPSSISNEEFTHLMLESLDGFVIVFSATGHIHFASQSITSLLGHLPADIMNQSIFDLAYDEDRPSLYSLLRNPITSVDTMQAVVLKENQIKFQCHIRRGSLDIREEPIYELVEFIGYFRSNLEPLESERIGNYSIGHDSRFLFVCMGKLLLPQLMRDMPPADSAHREFVSQLSLEWKYLLLDHRAPPIIGYLPFEVLGTSDYDYYHMDDLDKIISCHKTLMQKGKLTSCYYRFLTKGQQWLWLQTHYHISYHQFTSKPEFVVCNHTVVSYADVVEKIKAERGLAVDTYDDAVTEPDVSMSPSHVSERSDDNDRHNNSHRTSGQSMSGGSGTVSLVEAPQPNPAADFPASVSAASSASASCVGGFAPYVVPSVSQARSRYSSSDGSAPSVDMRLRRWAHSSDYAPAPRDTMGAQYLEPMPYVLPLVVTPAHVQLQLQRKHQKLQQLIVMQQAELRRVAEQIVAARLGLPSHLDIEYNGIIVPNNIVQPMMYQDPLAGPPPMRPAPPPTPPDLPPVAPPTYPAAPPQHPHSHPPPQ